MTAIGRWGTKTHQGCGVPGCMSAGPKNSRTLGTRAQEITDVMLRASRTERGDQVISLLAYEMIEKHAGNALSQPCVSLS